MEYSKEIEISTGIEPDFLQNILTKDISTLEALYDLIDNSIDAARNNIIQNSNYEKDEMGLQFANEQLKRGSAHLPCLPLEKKNNIKEQKA